MKSKELMLYTKSIEDKYDAVLDFHKKFEAKSATVIAGIDSSQLSDAYVYGQDMTLSQIIFAHEVMSILSGKRNN